MCIIKNTDLKTFWGSPPRKKTERIGRQDIVFVILCDSKLCIFIHLINDVKDLSMEHRLIPNSRSSCLSYSTGIGDGHHGQTKLEF